MSDKYNLKVAVVKTGSDDYKASVTFDIDGKQFKKNIFLSTTGDRYLFKYIYFEGEPEIEGELRDAIESAIKREIQNKNYTTQSDESYEIHCVGMDGSTSTHTVKQEKATFIYDPDETRHDLTDAPRICNDMWTVDRKGKIDKKHRREYKQKRNGITN